MSNEKYYLNIGSAKDLPKFMQRVFYRTLEILPGALIWLTFIAMFVVSFFAPLYAAIFIILFDVYWFLKSIYFSWHLRTSFKVMRDTQKIDWTQELDKLDLSSNQLGMKLHGQASGISTYGQAEGLPVERNPVPKTTIHPQASPWSSGTGIKNWREDLWHMILIPYYKEGYEVLESTFQGILNCGYKAERFIVVLSGEERAGSDSRKIGERIKQEFGQKFGQFLLTFHEDGTEELAGKGANETWAARKTKEKIIDPQDIPYEKILVSVFDADTVPSPNYFSRLTYKFLTCEKPLRTSFQPIPLFINNIWEAPGLARIISFSSTFFHMMNQMRPERLVSFSSHAFPFKALVEMDFWQTNVVSEDSRIFWQGLLNFDGDWRVVPLNVPVSMDANVAETFWKTMVNLYRQQRRWAYGSADIAYFIYGFSKNKKIPLMTKLYWSFHLVESFWAWGTNSLMIFAMGWLPILLGGAAFNTTIISYYTPRMATYIMSAAMLGIVTLIYISLVLLPPKPPIYGRHKYALMVLQWFFIPITLIFSGSIPAIDAQTRLMLGKYMGFWPTPKIRKGIQTKIFD